METGDKQDLQKYKSLLCKTKSRYRFEDKCPTTNRQQQQSRGFRNQAETRKKFLIYFLVQERVRP